MKVELVYPEGKKEILFDMIEIPNKGDLLDLYDNLTREYSLYEVSKKTFYFHGDSTLNQRKIDFISIKLYKIPN